METAIKHDKFSLGSFALNDFLHGTFWVIFLFGIALVALVGAPVCEILNGLSSELRSAGIIK